MRQGVGLDVASEAGLRRWSVWSKGRVHVLCIAIAWRCWLVEVVSERGMSAWSEQILDSSLLRPSFFPLLCEKIQQVRMRLAGGVRLLVLAWVMAGSEGCSFLVANYNLSSEHSAAQLEYANFHNRMRGPDATRMVEAHSWAFLHNLLSMTGNRYPSSQPFTPLLLVLFLPPHSHSLPSSLPRCPLLTTILSAPLTASLPSSHTSIPLLETLHSPSHNHFLPSSHPTIPLLKLLHSPHLCPPLSPSLPS